MVFGSTIRSSFLEMVLHLGKTHTQRFDEMKPTIKPTGVVLNLRVSTSKVSRVLAAARLANRCPDVRLKVLTTAYFSKTWSLVAIELSFRSRTRVMLPQITSWLLRTFQAGECEADQSSLFIY